MTFRELEAEAKKLADIFSCVRLLDENSVCGKGKPVLAYGCSAEELCYEYAGRKTPCEDCLSAKCLQEKTNAKKTELICGRLIKVYVRYYEADGKSYVLELIDDFKDDSISDTTEQAVKVYNSSDYYDKLYKDALTGCFNRRYYEENLKTSTEKVGIALIDIDDFKLYNDVYGHDAGDTVLSAIAVEIKSCLREIDQLIRYGGDEFLLVMKHASDNNFINLLFDIRSRVNTMEISGYTGLTFSVSIGGVCTHGEQIWQAVNIADQLMYRAKRSKNVIVTDHTDDEIGIKKIALVVDDSAINREILATVLKNDFEIVEAASGQECVDSLKKYGDRTAVVLLDLVMPGTDGFYALEKMRSEHLADSIPIIITTGDSSNESIARAYEIGIADYINRPFDVKVIYSRVKNAISLYSRQKRLENRATKQIIERENDMRAMTAILGQIVEFRNCESCRHIINMRRLTEMMLKRLLFKTSRYNLSSVDVLHIVNASALHDIGKIAVDEKIINKPGKLTPEEYEIVKQHTVIGSKMLEALTEEYGDPLLKYARQICLYHHERWDGKGYPEGLKGEEIPIAAQVVSICDVYDALTEDRVYKKAIPAKEALEMIYNGECGQFNPLLMECLRDSADELIKEDKIRHKLI